MYQAEISTPETRGAMVSITGIAYALGYTIAGWLGYACSFMPVTAPHANFAFKFPLAFQCFFPFVVILGQKFIPESPRYLLAKKRTEGKCELCILKD